jgi:hypothetical protein
MIAPNAKMQFFPPEVSTGLNAWPNSSQATATLGALHAAAMGQRFEAAQQLEMNEIKGRLNVLVELSARQSEQQEFMRKQMEEQAKFMSQTMAAVQSVQSQVNSMRNELVDLYRSNAAPKASFEGQMRRRLEPKRTEDDEQLRTSEDPESFAERVKARRGMSTNSAKGSPIASNAQCTSHRSRTVSRETSESPQRLLSEEAAIPPPEMSTSTVVSESGRSDEDAVQVTASSFFNRSPPGLCLYSDEARDEAWISEVANEIKNLIITNDRKCVDAVKRTSAEVLNKTDHDGMTVFHYAAMHGNARACEAIVSHDGFSATTTGDRNSNTAMHIATLHDQGNVCQVILGHDPAAASVTNRFGDTPLDIAQRRGIDDVCAAFKQSLQ